MRSSGGTRVLTLTTTGYLTQDGSSAPTTSLSSPHTSVLTVQVQQYLEDGETTFSAGVAEAPPKGAVRVRVALDTWSFLDATDQLYLSYQLKPTVGDVADVTFTDAGVTDSIDRVDLAQALYTSRPVAISTDTGASTTAVLETPAKTTDDLLAFPVLLPSDQDLVYEFLLSSDKLGAGYTPVATKVTPAGSRTVTVCFDQSDCANNYVDVQIGNLFENDASWGPGLHEISGDSLTTGLFGESQSAACLTR